jgi:hypothetical protein
MKLVQVWAQLNQSNKKTYTISVRLEEIEQLSIKQKQEIIQNTRL